MLADHKQKHKRTTVRNQNISAALGRPAMKLLGGFNSFCNVCEKLICKLVYLSIVFGEYDRYIGKINHL